MPTSTAPVGLNAGEVRDRARRGEANTPVSGSTRTTTRILRTSVFSFYNNILFVIGLALLGLGRYNDALVSVGLGLINAALAAVQELRARRKLDRIQLLARSRVRVLREGAEREVGPEEVVRGDLVRVAPGDQIVVDGPVEQGELEVDESLLTGEADPVRKADGETLLSGSSCSGGRGWQRAEAVGTASYAGRLTLAARADTADVTPLQRRIDLVVRLVMVLVVLMSAAILVQAALEGSTLLRFVQTSAVLSGLVPYGLFFLIAVAYAVGAGRIVSDGALVQRTAAVEAVATVDVVCTDKTGTLTSGALTLTAIEALGLDPALARALLATLAHTATSADPTTTALAAALPSPEPLPEPVDEVAFSSSLRWSGVDTGSDVLVLGAHDALAPALVTGAAAGAALTERVAARADEGLRVLLLGRVAHAGGTGLRDAEDRPRLPGLEPVAVVTLADELRGGADGVLSGLTAEGVALKVLSGDDPRTVAALARRVGVRGPSISGPELAAMAPEAFDVAVDEHAVFGRAGPEQKEAIIAALRRRGRHVAMVGDGVNDARALKMAHVGVAMRSGSSVTRDVADVVLLHDSFAALAPARREGRRILAGIGTSMFLFLARVATAMLVIVVVTMLGLGFPYTPTQVGLTLFTVGLPTFFLTLWARPLPPEPDLLASLARFVIPVAVVTAGFGSAVFAILSTAVTRGLASPGVPAEVIARFQEYTGLTYGVDADFVDAAATLGGQTGLSIFVSVTAFILVLLLEPPIRLFTAWRPVVSDRRPTYLARAARRLRRRAGHPRHLELLRAHQPRASGGPRGRARRRGVVPGAQRRAALASARPRPRPDGERPLRREGPVTARHGDPRVTWGT